LPAVFVALGAGASFASLITVFPFLITLSQYKVYITLFALVMIGLAGYVNYKTYYMPCPIDPEIGRTCMNTRRRARRLYYISVAIFLFATVFTYVVPNFL
jgi:hypothetical protein